MNLYAYVGGDPINAIDPEGLHKKDKWYGYNNKDFQKWFHRCWKEQGNPNADKAEIEEAYDEWVRSGMPKGGKCGEPPPGEPVSDDICGDDCKELAKTAAMLGTGYVVYKIGKVCVLTFVGGPVGFTLGVVTP